MFRARRGLAVARRRLAVRPPLALASISIAAISRRRVLLSTTSHRLGSHHRLQQQQTRPLFQWLGSLWNPKREREHEHEAAQSTSKSKSQNQNQSKLGDPSSDKTSKKPAPTNAPKLSSSLSLQGSTTGTTFSVGKHAKLADGSVMATQGDSMVLATAVSMRWSPTPGTSSDFVPLTVDYRVKYHAVGRIPDTARRKELGNSDEDILASRALDRVLRPLFPKDNVLLDTQILATVQSLDPDNDAYVLAINAASAALMVSDIPWEGPIGCVRVAEVDGRWIARPTAAQRALATFELLYAGTEDKTLMMEAVGEPMPESRLVEAMKLAQKATRPIIAQQRTLAKQHGKPKRQVAKNTIPSDVLDQAVEMGVPLVNTMLESASPSKLIRQQHERELYAALQEKLRERFPDAKEFEDGLLQRAAHSAVQKGIRDKILSGEKNCRLDGRATWLIRPLGVETTVLPMAHGSCFFSRGDTQTLCSVTLGPLDAGLRERSATRDPNDSEEPELKHVLLQYEFPPYATNETGRLGGINRRMVGHSALAEKAVNAVLPSVDAFPYTIRMTSETTSSDGSSSMATTCGVAMALMDAGVPIKSAVAGISIGLVTAGDPFASNKDFSSKSQYRLLTDILGSEDHYGDMDFKVAGTEHGVTALQLDVKLPGGVPVGVLAEALDAAKRARGFVLGRMASVLPRPRGTIKASVSGEVNIAIKLQVPTTAIGGLIGPGGAKIRELERTTECDISIDRTDGEVRIVGPADKVALAKTIVLERAGGGMNLLRIGESYEMRVVDVMDFGARLQATNGGHRGFVHISELADHRVANIHDELKVDDVRTFQCVDIRGSDAKMSLKAKPTTQNEASGNASATPPVGTFFQPGNKYSMRVTEVLQFGALLESTADPMQRGSIHITELSHDRIDNIHDMLQVGDTLDVVCIEGGKMSRKQLPPLSQTTASGGGKRRGPPSGSSRSKSEDQA